MAGRPAELTSAWTKTMDQVTSDRSLRAVVVTGKGSAFCSGAQALAQPVTMSTADIHKGIRAAVSTALLPSMAASGMERPVDNPAGPRNGRRAGRE